MYHVVRGKSRKDNESWQQECCCCLRGYWNHSMLAHTSHYLPRHEPFPRQGPSHRNPNICPHIWVLLDITLFLVNRCLKVLDIWLELTITLTLSVTLTPLHYWAKLYSCLAQQIRNVSLYPSNLLKFQNFWYIIDPKVFKRTSNAMICIPRGLLREINRYQEVWLEFG